MKIDVYLETGKKRVFAAAVDWPGWSRSGRDEAAALQALLDYGPRYARVMREAGIEFQAPEDAARLAVVERLEGDATTDFGAPGAIPAADERPVDEAGLERLRKILRTCWQALDAAATAAAGKELRKGPRGGGRELEGILRHVRESEAGYLGALGWKVKRGEAGQKQRPDRADILEGLEAAARGELPAQGPRGGRHWPPRYFVRRDAWHILDHAWEIEDRLA